MKSGIRVLFLSRRGRSCWFPFRERYLLVSLSGQVLLVSLSGKNALCGTEPTTYDSWNPMEFAMTTRTNRLASTLVLLSALLFAGTAFGASMASAQNRSEVVDPFSAEPTTPHTELLDPFADAPRRAALTPRTTDLLDPFASTARRAARYLAELLDPWLD